MSMLAGHQELFADRLLSVCVAFPRKLLRALCNFVQLCKDFESSRRATTKWRNEVSIMNFFPMIASSAQAGCIADITVLESLIERYSSLHLTLVYRN